MVGQHVLVHRLDLQQRDRQPGRRIVVHVAADDLIGCLDD